MKKIFTYLFGLICVFSLKAQTNEAYSDQFDENSYAKFLPLDIIDEASVEIIYEYHAIDSVLDKMESCIDILQVGEMYSKYFAYSSYQTDSVIHYCRDVTRITHRESDEIFDKYDYGSGSSYEIVKNCKTSTLDYYDRIFIDYYVYQDSIAIPWMLEDDTATVCGYPCQTATCGFRGRTWKAYYTTEIAKNDGPWKFSGLPGMILKLQDNKGEQTFTAIVVRNADSKIYTKVKRDRIKTTRTRFNEQFKDYRLHQMAVLAGNPLLGKDPNTGKVRSVPNTRRFYSPVELE